MLFSSIIILAISLPITTIAAFIVGYNVNADKKLFKKPTKKEKTEIEKEIEYIENAWKDGK